MHKVVNGTQGCIDMLDHIRHHDQIKGPSEAVGFAIPVFDSNAIIGSIPYGVAVDIHANQFSRYRPKARMQPCLPMSG